MPNHSHCRDEDDRDDSANSDSHDDRPKYLKARDQLVERISSGAWRRGQLIPSEQDVARELDVSPGTARRALGMLVDMGLITRRHGSGTWVQAESRASQYRFFSFFDEDNVRIEPGNNGFIAKLACANSRERFLLNLQEEARVIRISRTRTRAGRPFIAEKLSLPEALFPNLAGTSQLPDALYDFYHKTDKVLVIEVADRLEAVAANATTAGALGVKIGTPLLKVDRIAYAPKHLPVEWRVWLCHLRDAHYLAHMGGAG
jgi:GntR family transcriptional regulator